MAGFAPVAKKDEGRAYSGRFTFLVVVAIVTAGLGGLNYGVTGEGRVAWPGGATAPLHNRVPCSAVPQGHTSSMLSQC